MKLWPNATGNILMLVSIILVAIIVIGGLVWGFSSEKKENFYATKAKVQQMPILKTKSIEKSMPIQVYRPMPIFTRK